MRTFFLLFLVLVALALPGGGQQAPTEVRVLHVDGVINPIAVRYLERGIRSAEQEGAHLVVVHLNTPGGLDTSMRAITTLLLGARVPVAVYVSPAGGRAASAGMFVTIAAHVAAMAPGTNIGAAHPVSLGGETTTTMEKKVVNDAAALARSLARERGRNAAWVEDAVRKSVSITANEALEKKVIDLVAVDRDDLLRQLNRRTVSTLTGEVTLNTAHVRIAESPMGFADRFLMAISEPNVAYILFSLGSIGIIAELYAFGTLIPGTIGVVSLILAFMAFGTLPVNWAGVALLGVGVALLGGELLAPGVGFFGVAGVLTFALGSLILFVPLGTAPPLDPSLRVSPWLIAFAVLALAATVLGFGRAVRRSMRTRISTGPEALIDVRGMATTDLAPSGRVNIAGESWSAIGESPLIPAGSPIRVTAVEGVILRVDFAERTRAETQPDASTADIPGAGAADTADDTGGRSRA